MSRFAGFERSVQLQKYKFFNLYYNASKQSSDLCISIRKIILLFILEEYREKFQNIERDNPIVFEFQNYFIEVIYNYRSNPFVKEVCKRICETKYDSDLVWENMFRIMKHAHHNQGEKKEKIYEAFPPYKNYQFKPRKRRKIQNEGEYLNFTTMYSEVKSNLEKDSTEFLRLSSPFQNDKEKLLEKLEEMEKEVELMQKKMVSQGFCEKNYWKIYLYRDPSINPLSDLKKEYDNLIAKLKHKI